MLKKTIALIAILVIAPRLATAQEAATLNEDRIRSFIASMNELEAWGDDHEAEVDALDDVWSSATLEDVTNPFAAATNIIESQPWAGEVVGIVESHGFDGLESWARTGNRIFMAVMAVQMDFNEEEMEAGMAEALKQIEASGMSEAQKEEMRKMLRASAEMSEAYRDVPEADKKAIIPFLDDLENMGSESEE